MIVAAAILFEGKVYVGIHGKDRHHDVIRNIVRETGTKYVPNHGNGFIDDKGTFMHREEAGQHALACGQLKSLRYNGKKLYSEDLW